MPLNPSNGPSRRTIVASWKLRHVEALVLEAGRLRTVPDAAPRLVGATAW
jgi:hypothetical protein